MGRSTRKYGAREMARVYMETLEERKPYQVNTDARQVAPQKIMVWKVCATEDSENNPGAGAGLLGWGTQKI